MNRFGNFRRWRQDGLTLLGVILTIAFIGLIAIGIIYVFGKQLSANSGAAVTQGTAVVGQYTALPPPSLTADAPVTYNVVTRNYTLKGAGSPVMTGTAVPAANAEVTFRLSSGDAAIDGTAEKTVYTDNNGNATVTLSPMRTGADALTVTLTYGNVSGDEDPVQFEVDRQGN